MSGITPSDQLFTRGVGLLTDFRGKNTLGTVKKMPYAAQLAAVDEVLRTAYAMREMLLTAGKMVPVVAHTRNAPGNSAGVGLINGVVKAVNLMPPPAQPYSGEVGRPWRVDKTRHDLPASPPLPHRDDAGHSMIARQAGLAVPASSLPHSEGKGREAFAVQARGDVPSSSLPNRDGHGARTTVPSRPTDLFPRPSRPLTATERASNIRVAAVMAKSIFDTFKMTDGKVIGDVRLRELHGYRKAARVEAFLAERILKNHVHADQNKRVRDVETAASIAAIIKRAEKESSNERIPA